MLEIWMRIVGEERWRVCEAGEREGESHGARGWVGIRAVPHRTDDILHIFSILWRARVCVRECARSEGVFTTL